MRRFTTFQHIRVSAVFALLLSIVLTVFTGAVAHAVPTPTSGPASGGTAVTINGIHFVQVAAGGDYALGLTSEGTVYAWGHNGSGQLGDGSTTDRSVPVQVLGGAGGGTYLTGVTSISAGVAHSVAVTSSGVFAWGYNFSGELGDGSTTDSSVPVRVLAVGGTAGSGPYLTGVTSISAGASHSVALTSSGVFAWGYNGFGQLGDGSTTNSSVPVRVLAVGGTAGSGTYLTGVTSISAGAFHSVAVTSSGVFAWGYNFSGQLGDGSTTSSSVPVQVLGGAGGGTYLTGVTSISAGAFHSVAVTSSGVFAWGDNGFGELGDGSTTNRSVPVQVLGGAGGGTYLTGVTSISAGYYHSVAVTSSGVFAWGYNAYGALGDGSTTDSSVPVQVLGGAGGGTYLTGVTSIVAGGFHSVAVTSSGVLAWGYNFSGQLGDGSTTARSVPVLGPNFQPGTVTVGALAPITPTVSGDAWSFTTPAHAAGDVTLTGTANVFGGTTAASPATVSWNAGTFTFEAALANTGAPNMLPFGVTSAGALFLGAGLLLALRRSQRK